MRDIDWVFTDRDGNIVTTIYATPVTIGRDKKTGRVVVDDRREKKS